MPTVKAQQFFTWKIKIASNLNTATLQGNHHVRREGQIHDYSIGPKLREMCSTLESAEVFLLHLLPLRKITQAEFVQFVQQQQKL